MDVSFELCADSLAACLAAREGGADRIELCSALSEGGLTPSHGMIHEAVRQSQLPVFPILRSRGGDFVYSAAEFDVMRADLLHAMELGASGFVVGLLDEEGRVDVRRTREIVALAHPLEVTFHRAFDCVRNLSQALEEVLDTGCRRILSSGGRSDVVKGAEVLAGLVTKAAGRICIAAGGGLRLANAAEVARVTRAPSYHGSLRTQHHSSYVCVPGEPSCLSYRVEADDVRSMLGTLRKELKC